jgi:hypothetical protein
MDITVTQTVSLDESSLSSTPAEIGQWMLDCALTQWYQYDDEGNFDHHSDPLTGNVTISDPDEEKSITITPYEFFKKHVELIWLATIDNYRHDWIDFAFKSSGADADEYDANTCDAVLQNLLYGEIVYG